MQEQNELTELEELTNIAYEDIMKECEENAKNFRKETEDFIKMMKQDRLFIEASYKKMQDQHEKVKSIYEEIVASNSSPKTNP